ncbi:hypothetical protein [Brevundimonas sp.]|uniref:hypothetical protein n=1 Tax=Brevundimonas sp. TaxID=1871086 RepID=UPI003AFF95F0
MRETEQLFPVENGFAKVTAPSAELPLPALIAYKALLIELAKRGFLSKAQDAYVLLKPRDGIEAEPLDVLRQLSSVSLEYRLDVEPAGITYTSLVASYDLTRLEDSAAEVWEAELKLPSGLLAHLAVEVSKQRDWIEKNVFPTAASWDMADARWTENLTIRCVPRDT